MLAFWLESLFLRKLKLPRFGFFFLVGLFFSLLGIAIAVLTHVWLVAVFVVAISVLPFLTRNFSVPELSGQFVFGKPMNFFSKLFDEYAAFFLGVFFAFLILGVLGGPGFVSDFTGFSVQGGLSVEKDSLSSFVSGVLFNNLGVLLVGFLVAMLFEFGASLVTSWNAVFWGLLAASRIHEALVVSGEPFSAFFWVLAIMPHLIVEALAYISAMFAGLSISFLVRHERELGNDFAPLLYRCLGLLAVGVFLVILGAVLEGVVFWYVV